MKYNFTPFPTLATQRLIIRQTTLDDVDEVSFLRNDAEVNKYIARSSYASDAADFIQKVNNSIENGTTISWSIQFKDDSFMVGSICLWNFSEEKNSAEVGYAMNPKYQKQGIMSEALQCTLDYGFNELNFEMIEAFTHRENKASKMLLLKHGFVHNENRHDDHNSNNLIFEVYPKEIIL